MNSKEHVLRLVVVERELRAFPDDELVALIAKSSDQVQQWFAKLGGSEEDGLDIKAVRGAVQRGRMKGVPDRVASFLTEPCMDDCVAALGAQADFPSEEDLRRVTPGLVERHGLPTTRLMFASALLSDAPASAAITKILKSDPALARPAA